ncbi:MAG: hypothetical protein AAFV26_06295, partial [Pseudomonadota bacterium]
AASVAVNHETVRQAGERDQAFECVVAVRYVGAGASAIGPGDLVSRAVTLLKDRLPDLALPTVTVEKIIPAAAGLGGGSADVAAYLRLVRSHNAEAAGSVDWAGLALQLGADVPVCLVNETSWVAGIGEQLSPVRLADPLYVVLANPQTSVPADKTRAVFKAFAARGSAFSEPRPPSDHSTGLSGDDLDRLMSTAGNDLEAAAVDVVPEIAQVRRTLEACDGARHVRLSGAGPTMFAVFDRAEAAEDAAAEVSAREPGWWVQATTLGAD